MQGTPTKGETPSKSSDKKHEDQKENILRPIDENNAVEESSIVNETFGSKSAKLLTFKDLHSSPDQVVMDGGSSVKTSGDDKYSCIALLDDEHDDEKWEERTSVITKNDHEEYVAAAEAILSDLLADVKTPVKR